MTDHNDPEPVVAAEFARFRQVAREIFAGSPPASVGAARAGAARRRTAVVLAAAAVVLMMLAGTVVVRAIAAPGPPSPATPPVSGPTAPAAAGPLTGVPMTGPTGLQLLLPRWLLDIDAGADRPVPITGWLPRPGAAPLLAEWDWDGDYLAPVEITTGVATDLPGRPPVVQLNRDGIGTMAVSVDANGLWVVEQRQPDDCTLREVDLTGQERRPPRRFACDTRLTAETASGLWVTEGDPDGDGVLLDPDSLQERARFAAVEPVDDQRVIVTEDDWRSLELRDLRTGEVTPLERPPARGWPAPEVGQVSPDGRWLPFSFGQPDRAQQVIDVWLLDLQTAQWLHLPSMPAFASLKFTSLGWAGDGRLVMLGIFFPDDGQLVTWRPGEPDLALMPYERPEADPDEPYSDWILVL